MKNNVDKARETLHNAGFYVGNLWTIQDVQDKFKCDTEQAQEVLDRALTNEWVMEQIQYAIGDIAEDMGLTEIEDEDE